MKINLKLQPADLTARLQRFWHISADKIQQIEKYYNSSKGSPVFTVKGKYTSRGWTEWTQGFQYGSSILQFDATGERRLLDLGRTATVQRMARHVSHFGVHDHGFNNVSTYGNLWRLMSEGRIPENQWERDFYELALKLSGAVQARRWTRIKDGGFLYSFNGPHSLFVDTIRSLRSLAIAHQLGHVLMDEGDCHMQSQLRRIPCTTAKAAMPTMFAAAWRMKRFSTPVTAASVLPIRSRDIQVSVRGPAAWRGPCADSASNWSFCAR